MNFIILIIDRCLLFLKHLLKESEIFGNINFLKYFYKFLIYKKSMIF